MTNAQLAALSTADMAVISTAQIATLSGTQITAFSAMQLNALPTADIHALTKAQTQALTTTQIGGLSASEMTSLSVANFTSYVLTNITSLGSAALSGINLADIQSMTAAQINGLSSGQVSALSGAAASYAKDIRAAYAELAGFMADNTLSFSEAEALLKDTVKGGMTAGEFAALKAIAGSLNTTGGYATSALVAQLFGDVVNGNAANAKWTGGAKASVSLGNLSATSTELQGNELVAKWFDGADNPILMNSCGTAYKTQTGNLFAATTDYTQVNQGGAGDCYFESAMIAVTVADPSILKKMITQNSNGTYTVDFYNGDKQAHDYVTVDLQMQQMASNYSYRNGSHLAFDNGGASGTLWSEIIEKAYVEYRAQTSGGTNSYDNIWGGWDNGLTALTGQSVQDCVTWSGEDSASLTNLLTRIDTAMKNHECVMMNDTSAMSSQHLVGSHMYAVLGVNVAAGTVTIDNPWNASGFTNPKDAVFTDTIAGLASDGVTFHIAQGSARSFL